MTSSAARSASATVEFHPKENRKECLAWSLAEPHRREHVRDGGGPRLAGRSRRRGDTQAIEPHQQGLVLHPESKMAMLGCGQVVGNGALGAIRQLGLEGLPGFADSPAETVPIGRGRRHGRSHACDPGHVVGTAAAPVLLATAVQQRLDMTPDRM